jgi:hypothetical protein
MNSATPTDASAAAHAMQRADEFTVYCTHSKQPGAKNIGNGTAPRGKPATPKTRQDLTAKKI